VPERAERKRDAEGAETKRCSSDGGGERGGEENEGDTTTGNRREQSVFPTLHCMHFSISLSLSLSPCTFN